MTTTDNEEKSEGSPRSSPGVKFDEVNITSTTSTRNIGSSAVKDETPVIESNNNNKIIDPALMLAKTGDHPYYSGVLDASTATASIQQSNGTANSSLASLTTTTPAVAVPATEKTASSELAAATSIEDSSAATEKANGEVVGVEQPITTPIADPSPNDISAPSSSAMDHPYYSGIMMPTSSTLPTEDSFSSHTTGKSNGHGSAAFRSDEITATTTHSAGSGGEAVSATTEGGGGEESSNSITSSVRAMFKRTSWTGVMEQQQQQSSENGVPKPTTTTTEIGSSEISMDNTGSNHSSKQQRPQLQDTSDSHTSSLMMRKLPTDVLLRPSLIESMSVVSEGDHFQSHQRLDAAATTSAAFSVTAAGIKETSEAFAIQAKEKSRQFFLHNILCLKPTYSIRKQLMLSFGSINAITTMIVVGICILVAHLAGENIKETNTAAFETLERDSQGRSALYVARSFHEKLLPQDEINILLEVAQDRFQGYPNPTDDHVPFSDMISARLNGTERRMYPVRGTPMPLDWQLTPNINSFNYAEHFQNRQFWKPHLDKVSTANAGFFMRGSCNPNAVEATFPSIDPTYFENCNAQANNDISTGGVVAATNLTRTLYEKGSDIVPVLKALMESKEEIRDIGIHFANDGAGASMVYPQTVMDARWTFESKGCDWMRQANPYDPTRPIGTTTMRNHCHRRGDVVTSGRDYNAMETDWCAEQALHPDRLVVSAGLDELNERQSWLLTIGKGLYDRMTQNFIGCTYVGISLVEIAEELEAASQITDHSEVSLVLYNDIGTVIASSKEGIASQDIPIYEADLGLEQESYQELYTLIDFDMAWEPKKVSTEYKSFQTSDDVFLISAYPIPPIPETYDANYRPLFFVIMSTAKDEVFAAVQDANAEVDETVRQLALFSVIVGAIGLVLATLMILLMSHVLTSPLTSMNSSATDIVKNFGDHTKEGIIDASKGQEMVYDIGKCSPKTELNDVAREFNELVTSFSGKMMAKSEKGKYHEVSNQFGLHQEFVDLYIKRKSDPNFAYYIEGLDEASGGDDIGAGENSASMEQVPAPKEFHNRGSMFEYSFSTTFSQMTSLHRPEDEPGAATPASQSPPKWSPLFLWIVGLIVTPLLLSNFTITAVVMGTVSTEFSQSLTSIKGHFLDVQRTALLVHSSLRADHMSSLIRKPTRDAYLVTRYSGWLVLGGLERTDMFTESTTGAEECKGYDGRLDECPYHERESVCDCAWNEDQEACTDFPVGSSRRLQMTSFYGKSRPIDENGNRDISDYPDGSYSANTTHWWDDPLQVTGWEKGSNASGYETTYDRLRSISALPLLQPIYNYQAENRNLLFLLVSFEADGLAFGYRGCRNTRHVGVSAYETRSSDTMNRPELCPQGNYGYDPRCRSWYNDGKTFAIQNGTLLHVTAPYAFGTTPVVYAQTATIAIMDPSNGEHVGQILVDFFSDPLFTELDNHTFLSEQGFPVIVATRSDDDADTVVAPGFKRNETATALAQQVLPYDYKCETAKCKKNIMAFQEIVHDMKRGETANVTFTRSRKDGSNEKVHMAFAPVPVNSYTPVDSSDWTRGVEAEQYLVYSLGLAEPEAAILESFSTIEDTKNKQTRIAFAVLSVLIVLAAILVMFVSHHVATSITEPMVYLIDLIKAINRQGSSKTPLGFNTTIDSKRVNSSREVTIFAETMEMLHTLLRSANAAFYAGDLELAHSVLIDALRLFKRLENKKAIGIASNNLGNVVFSMYEQMKMNRLPRMGGLWRTQAVINGIAYYRESIQLGEALYDEFYNVQGWSPICLEFMQHLANRYFNRGLFLLCVKGDHKDPAELEQIGRRDLKIAREMDEEVVSYGEEIGWSSEDRVEKIFENLVMRVRGYNILLEQGYTDDWDVKELLDEAFDMIKTERKKPSSELFKRMSIVGRMQEVEAELMKYMRTSGDFKTAARIAIRMLVEDEVVFADSQAQAITTLLAYVEKSDDEDLDMSSRQRIRQALNGIRSNLEDAAEDQSVATFSELDASISRQGSILGGVSRRRRSSQGWSLVRSGGRFVVMEDF